MTDKSTILIQCGGHTKTPKKLVRCQKTVETPLESVRGVFCDKHTRQRNNFDFGLRRCDGVGVNGKPCSLPTGSATELTQPTFCNVHRNQNSSYTRCFGHDGDGRPCSKLIFWTPPYVKYCSGHSDQADNSSCAIANLSSDVIAMILSYFDAEEKIAFALVNKSCAALARASLSQPNSGGRGSLQVYVSHKDAQFQYDLTGQGIPPPGFHGYQYAVQPVYRKSQLRDDVRFPRALVMQPDPRCECWKPFNATNDPQRSAGHPWCSLYPLVEILWTGKLWNAVQAAPWLFTNKPRCILCHSKLSACAESRWAKLRTNGRGRRPIFSTIGTAYRRRRRPRNPYQKPPRTNLDLFLCSYCSHVPFNASANVNIKWCEKCRGKLTWMGICEAHRLLCAAPEPPLPRNLKPEDAYVYDVDDSEAPICQRNRPNWTRDAFRLPPEEGT